ncbi:MAG: 16S rRNA (guanine(527)-N(7))-methyltransferase RsmG [candidate division WOR-3 bacterium]|jgi:16S rRNA (guanine527-N7)-methyltransferase
MQEKKSLIIYKELLKKYNKVLHLTSKNANLNELISQSIYIQKFIKENSVIMDVGSGGGIVGIPLKIVRNDLKVYLVERSEKKCTFLEIAIKQLNLKDVFVINQDYKNVNFNFKFDYILARALGNYEELLKHLKKFLNESGSFIIFSDVEIEGFKIKKEKIKNLTITLISL